MAALEYVEVWTDFQAAGGTRLGFLCAPATAEDDIGVDGQDSARAAWPKSYAKTALLTEGAVLRFVFSDGSWHEWEIRRTAVASGSADRLYTVECVGVQDRLRRVPVTLVDGDGWIYFDVPAVALTPASILDDLLLADAPAWIVPGTIDPTEREDIQFTQDTALSGLGKLATQVGEDWELAPNGTTEYRVHLRRRGASAPAVRFRTGKNLQSLRRETSGVPITRVIPIGADGDAGPATLAWAYWKVLAVASPRVQLGPIHGSGPGPIAYDDQFNHASLGATYYLQRRDGTYVQVLDSFAATQELELASVTTISAGDWVRIVASSTGRHVVSLDAPVEIAAHGIHPGPFTSPWDDTLNINDNPLMLDHANPSARPDGYGGALGIWTKETGAGLFITGTSSAKVVWNQTSPAEFLLTRARSWFIDKRRSTFSVTMWIRVTSLFSGGVGLRLTRAGNAIGEMLVYKSPINVWRELKIEGVSLAAFEGTVQTIGFQLLCVPDDHPGSGPMAGTAYVDSVQISPSVTARAITHGSNAARIWQQANDYLDERRVVPVTYTIQGVDLERAGIPRTAPIAVGGPAIVDEEELGVAGLAARIMRRRRDLRRELVTSLVASTTDRPRRRLASPEPLTIPFFEPIRLQAADRDTRLAAQTLKAEVTGTTATQVTITLSHSDVAAGSPVITRAQLNTTYVSGSGLGPYVYTRPANGAGIGQVIFTARLGGRSDVIATVEVPEQEIDVGNIHGAFATVGGAFDFRLEGSATTGSWRYAVSTSAMPADATVDAASPVNGRSVNVTNAATAALDAKVYVKARAYTGTGGTGTPAGGYIEATFRRDAFNATKTIRVPYSEFMPVSETTKWLCGAFYLAPNVASAEQVYIASIVVPKGVTITNVAWRWRRGSTGDTVRLYFYRGGDAGLTTLASVDPVSGTGVNTSSAAVSQLVGDEHYVSVVSLTGTAGTSVYLLWFEVTYTMPTPDKAY